MKLVTQLDYHRESTRPLITSLKEPDHNTSSVAQLASASDCYESSNREVDSSSLSGGEHMCSFFLFLILIPVVIVFAVFSG